MKIKSWNNQTIFSEVLAIVWGISEADMCFDDSICRLKFKQANSGGGLAA